MNMMNGAECLLRTLLNHGVELCLMNPGTSEMQFVAALDRVPGMRSVLCLFEGVCSGAADGYARMLARRPLRCCTWDQGWRTGFRTSTMRARLARRW
jgi:TPP-dependent 2-oxoacid decarboxylase